MRYARGLGVAAATVVALGALASAAAAQAPAVSEALEDADVPRRQLDATSTRSLPSGSVVSRFAQEVGGVPVAGAGAVVDRHAGGAPGLIFDKTRPGVGAQGDPALTRARGDAGGAARRWTCGACAPRPRRASWWCPKARAPWPGRYCSRLARPFGDFLVTVDATTGAVLSERDLTRHATGEAKIYLTNAVVEKGGYGCVTVATATRTCSESLRSRVTLMRLNDGEGCLRGPWVNVRIDPGLEERLSPTTATGGT